MAQHVQQQVRSIPPAPRPVRLRALLAHRWPLLFVGGTMTVIGGLVAWAMFLQSGGKFAFGPRLASDPTHVVEGEVTEVFARRRFDGRDWDDVRYTFHVHESGQTVPVYGMCFVPSGSAVVGQRVPVEVLDGDEHVNCIEGGVLHLYRSWLYARFWIVVLVVPGGLTLMLWLLFVLRLRHVLAHGDVSLGHVVRVRQVRWVLPQMLEATYEFRDHRAKLRKNRHWVRTHGALGRLLLAHDGDAATVPVLHDRRLPHWNRMLLARDFLPEGPAHRVELRDLD